MRPAPPPPPRATRSWRAATLTSLATLAATMPIVAACRAGEAASDGTAADRPTTMAAERPDSAELATAAALVRAVARRERDPDGAVRAALDSAARLVPELADWLAWRAAALEPDAAARPARLRSLRVPAAVERAAVAEAGGRLAAGDTLGAASTLEALGRAGEAARLRLRSADNSPDAATARAAVRATLLGVLADAADSAASASEHVAAAGGPRPTPAARARDAAFVLDSAFAADPVRPLTAAERRLAGRAMASAAAPRTAAHRAVLERAHAALAAGLTASPAAAADLAADADVLAALRRWREAAVQWQAAADRARPAGADPLAGTWAYRAARARLRAGDAAGAQAALRGVVAAFPADEGAASARYLLADLAADAGRPAEARATFRAIADAHAASTWAPAGAFRAALLAVTEALTAGVDEAERRQWAATAARELDALVARWPSAADGPAARYWAGRAWQLAGDEGAARARWTALLAAGSPGGASYYGERAAARLGRAGWRPPAGGAAIAADPVAAASGRRAALLERVGLGGEAGMEREWLARWADSTGERRLAAAAALLEGLGGGDGARPGPGIRLAARAVAEGAPRTVAVERLLQPLLHAALVRREAAARGVDPALAAALIKQESNFTADAVSPAGARGLMQVMPATGSVLWRGPGAWSAARLFDPAVNVALGMRHLADGLRGWPDVTYALAAYNAGAGRVRRWRQERGAGDPELFVEQIPFEETRDYVRIVLGNRAAYRALYGL